MFLSLNILISTRFKTYRRMASMMNVFVFSDDSLDGYLGNGYVFVVPLCFFKTLFIRLGASVYLYYYICKINTSSIEFAK